MLKAFYQELVRRNVLRVAFAYLAGSWLLLQMSEILFPAFNIDESNLKTILYALIIGFLPAMVLAWVFEFTPGGIVVDENERPETDKRSAPEQTRTFDRIVIIVLALAVAAFAIDRFILQDTPQTTVADSDPVPVEFADASPASVAVLPFTNMSTSKENEYFSDGLTDTILHMLAQVNDLQVSARTSSFAFKGQNIDIRDVALTLGVAHVLEGSVQRSGNRIRVMAQLIRASDGFHVWSRNYDRDLDDVFAIQDEIANDVAVNLGSTLLDDPGGGIRSLATRSLSAYDIYLQALAKQASNTNQGLIDAEELFKAAITTDPEFADAKLALIRNHFRIAWKDNTRTEDLLAAVDPLLDELLGEDPDNVTLQSIRMYLEMYQASNELNMHRLDEILDESTILMDRGASETYIRRWVIGSLIGRRKDYEKAEQVLNDGLKTDPLNYDLLWAQAQLFESTDRTAEAKKPLMTARSVRPEDPVIHWRLGMNSYSTGEIVSGLNWLRIAAELDPEDAVIPAHIAQELYALGFIEEGHFWHQRSQHADQDGRVRSSVGMAIDVRAAQATGDDELIAKVSRETLEKILESDNGPTSTAMEGYTSSMMRLGRTREALDYLESKNPRYGDPTWVPRNIVMLVLKGWGVSLYREFMIEEEFNELARVWLDAVASAGMKLADMPASVRIQGEDWLGNTGAAKKIILGEVGSYSEDRWFWRSVNNNPFLDHLKSDPEVAARLEEEMAKEEAIKAEVSDLLKQPEWLLAGARPL